MNLDRFTVKSQEALERAQRIARENGNPDLGNFHLLAALLTEDESPVAAVLEKLGARREAIANEVAEALGRLPRVQGGSMRAGPAFVATLDHAEDIAQSLKDEFVSVEHLLLALAEPDADDAAKLTSAAARAHAAVLPFRATPAGWLLTLRF